MQMRQQLRYEEHLNMYPVAMQHSVYTIRTTLKVKGDECFFFFFYKIATDTVHCLSQLSPFMLQAVITCKSGKHKYVAHEP